MLLKMFAILLAAFLATSPNAQSNGDGPRLEFAEVGTVRMPYLDWGGSGEPLVLVPARCETPYVFGDLAPLLVHRFRVFGVWARGCAASGPASDGYDLDRQIQDLVAFLDRLKIKSAIFAGHSASGGKVVRLARLFPMRVARIVTFDIIYTNVPDRYVAEFQAAVAPNPSAAAPQSLESHRRDFEVWELGAWSSALERDFSERTERLPDGTTKFRPQAPGWQSAFIADIKAGRYHETTVGVPALFLVAQDLDIERVKRLPERPQRELLPMAESISRARSDQLASYQSNGSHVRVVPLAGASHYLFVDRAREVAKRMLAFLEETRR